MNSPQVPLDSLQVPPGQYPDTPWTVIRYPLDSPQVPLDSLQVPHGQSLVILQVPHRQSSCTPVVEMLHYNVVTMITDIVAMVSELLLGLQFNHHHHVISLLTAKQ